MKIKIIKRAATEKFMGKISATENHPHTKSDARKATETVKFWIEDLRQKRERERISVDELFRRKPCT